MSHERKRGRERILIVEDDADKARLLSMTLEIEGYDVAVAGNGLEAIEALRRGERDLILLDLMMPRMDGLRFLSWLRGIEGSSTPVAVLTAITRDDVLDECLEHGADAVLEQPWSPSGLLSRVAEMLESHR